MLKLNPKVAMMNSTISTTVMSGRWRRYFRPPSTPPRPLRPDGCSRDLSGRMRTVSVAANPRPVEKKTGPAPMRAVRTPATAGPVHRGAVKGAGLGLTRVGRPPPAPRPGRRSPEPVEADEDRERRGESQAADEEDRAGADESGEHTGHGGSDHAGAVEGGGVEADRVRQQLLAHELGDEGLAGR